MVPIDSIDIEKYDPIRSAQYLAGLLIDERYQSNLHRIAILLEYSVANFKGIEVPTTREFSTWLNEWEPILDHKNKLEDPCEDLYVSRCVTRWGDFRIFNGFWNGNEFFLRMVLEATSNFPPQLDKKVCNPIRAILLLSELIAERIHAKLAVIGDANERGEIILDALSDHSSVVVFTLRDLAAQGLTIRDFQPFIFNLENRERLNDQQLGNTDLERYPIVVVDDGLVVLRPTEISLAIRRYVIEWSGIDDNKTIFENRLVNAHLDALRRINIIDGFIFDKAPIQPRFDLSTCWVDVAMTWGNGKYLQVIVIIDTVFEFEKTGFNGFHSEQERLFEKLNYRLNHFRDQIMKQPDFRQGLSLIVLGGYGRSINMGEIDCPGGWNIISLPFFDLDTLQRVPEFPKSTFWKLSEQVSILGSRNIEFLNHSGFLNLYGWWLECDQMLLPHFYEIRPEHNLVFIPTDAISKVRQMAVLAADFRSAIYVDGTFKRIGKKSEPRTDTIEPHQKLYASFVDMAAGNLLGCALPTNRPWWVMLEKAEGQDLNLTFKLWDLTFNWMEPISETLENTFPEMNVSVIRYIVDVRQVVFDPTVVGKPWQGEIVKVEVSVPELTVRIILTSEFISAVYSPINTAERAIVRGCIDGFLLLSGIQTDEEEKERICNIIMPNEDARYFHVFTSQDYYDTLFLKKYPIKTIDVLDANFIKLGLAELSGETGKRKILGKEECKKFLSSIVRKLYDQTVESLSAYDREHIIKILFQNIYGIEHDQATWKRTSRAVMGLGKELDDYAVNRRRHFEELIAADLSSRILIEIAVCASKEEGGIEADRFDLSPLMAKVSLIYYLGNLSDGIDKGIIEAEIEVVGNGEIWQSNDFQKKVMGPLTIENEKESSVEDAKQYLDLFENKTSGGNFPSAFIEAFSKEFGVSPDEMIQFAMTMDALFNDQDIVIIRMEALKALVKEHAKLNMSVLEKIIEGFSLRPRLKHSEPPPGFTGRDLSPWLFRRRLSLLFKPIVRLKNDADPKLMIVPDFFFKAFMYISSTYFNSGMDANWCRSREMKSWIGENAHQMGMKFNHDFANELRLLGYEVLEEVKITQLLPPSVLASNYGDVDVIAWKKGTTALFMIECKDLFFAKTFREMAEQMLGYRGETRNGEPDNLKKHINRLAILSQQKDRIKTKFDGLLLDFTLHGFVVFSKRVPVLYDTTYKGSIKFSFQEEVKQNGLSTDSIFSD